MYACFSVPWANVLIKLSALAISKAISSVNNVGVDASKALPPVDFSKKATLFENSVSCPPLSEFSPP
jgi:hypothetical protein